MEESVSATPPPSAAPAFLAQSDRAPVYGTGGYRFESCRGHFDSDLGCRADVVQLVEQHLPKVWVAGSNPVIRSMVDWPSGEAVDCKSTYTGSSPVSTSMRPYGLHPEPRGSRGQGLLAQ